MRAAGWRVVLAAAWTLAAGAALADPQAGAAPQADTPAATPPNAASASPPDVAALLFSGSNWAKAPVGSAITYDYAKTVADTAAFGPSFTDHIVLTLSAGESATARTAEVRMFSGTHSKAAGPFLSDEQNPVLLLVLEESVQELSKSFKANPRYIKNAIRKAWRTKPKIEPVQLTVGEKSVAGTRVTVQPFLDDAEADKMKGLSTMIVTVDASADVPGYLAAIDIHGPAEGAPTFSEHLQYGAIKLP